MSPRMKIAISLLARHKGDRRGFIKAAQEAGFTAAGAATYWQTLQHPTPRQKTYLRVSSMALLFVATL